MAGNYLNRHSPKRVSHRRKNLASGARRRPCLIRWGGPFGCLTTGSTVARDGCVPRRPHALPNAEESRPLAAQYKSLWAAFFCLTRVPARPMHERWPSAFAPVRRALIQRGCSTELAADPANRWQIVREQHGMPSALIVALSGRPVTGKLC